MPGATPFQGKLKEYELKAPAVGMFGEISKDGESILEIAAWKRLDAAPWGVAEKGPPPPDHTQLSVRLCEPAP